jgi:hypothetical protein
MLGSILFVLIAVVAVTGLISHSAYQPDLVAGYNATVPTGGDIGPLISLPADAPAWAYALSQGAHITVGLIAVPVLLAKLWSVIPRLFAYPPARSAADAVERLAVLLLVGSGLFEFVTGILNIQVFYPFHFGFVLAHYYGAWVFICALALHILVKLPTVRRAYRTHGVLRPLKDDLAHARSPPAPARSPRASRDPRRSPAAACSAWSVRAPSRCCSPIWGSRSEARCGGSRCWRRGGGCGEPDPMTSRSTRPPTRWA